MPKCVYKFLVQEIPVKEPIGFLLLQKTTSCFLLGINNFIIIHKTYFIQLLLRKTWIFQKIYHILVNNPLVFY